MSKAFAYHIFAHDGGRYRTISAAGISELESKSLEQFFFGQTNDDSYLDSLEEEPGIIWRNLNGRGALTRVKNGQTDSNGRATLQFETILFPASQRAKASQKLDTLALSSWEFKEEGAFLSSSNGTEAGEVHPDKISDVSMAVREGERVVRRAADFSLTDVARIVTSCGDGTEFSLCFKSLNNTAPVTVNLVSLEVPERNMNATQEVLRQSSARHIQAESTSGSSGRDKLALTGICAILVIQIIMCVQTFPSSAGDFDFSKMQTAILGQIDATLTTVQKIHTNQSTVVLGLKEALDDVKTQLSQAIAESAKINSIATRESASKLDNLTATSKDQFSSFSIKLDGLRQLGKNIEDLHKELTDLSKRLGDLRIEVANLRADTKGNKEAIPPQNEQPSGSQVQPATSIPKNARDPKP